MIGPVAVPEAANEPRAEWRAVRVGLAAATLVVAAQLAVGAGYALVHDDPTPYDRALACLTREKSLAVETVLRDPIATSARSGALRTRVEGSGVTASFSASERAAERLRELYESVSELPPGALERRGRVVLVWEGSPSPTQRQTMYDCVG